jgi:hypothetical protein
MQGARGCNHDAIDTEIKNVIEGRNRLRIRRKLTGLGYHLWRWIRDGCNIDGSGAENRLHTMPADPADAEEAKARTSGRGLGSSPM